MLSRNLIKSLKLVKPNTLSIRTLTTLTPKLITQTTSNKNLFKSFSTSIPKFEATALSTKLAEEISFEAENTIEEPDFLKDFKAEGVWTIIDTPGADEVVLTRSYGKENIRILFSISDLDADQEESEDFSEELEEDSSNTSTTEESINEEGNEEENNGGRTEGSFPLDTSITITKPGKGTLSIDALAQDGLFTISNISFCADEKLALGMTSEEDWKRQGLYMGPDFENLDENVQTEFEIYLDERGINSGLALFLPDLAEFKEQNEYLTWLKQVKGFLEA